MLWRTLVAFSLIPEAVGFTATFYKSWPFTFIAGLIWGLAVGAPGGAAGAIWRLHRPASAVPTQVRH